MNKIIFHVDMDCFFAACEEVVNKDLKGKSVVIGSDPKEGKGRGVVATCNYAARAYGIHSAMPISKAYRLNKNSVFLRPNFKLYSRVSTNIMLILKKYSLNFQKMGLDEAYLDVTGKVEDWADAKILAYKIKNEISDKEKLTCSIGISSNKLVSKIASDFNKPDGITLVKNNRSFLYPLKVRKLYGVGPRSEQKLKKLGIESIGELANFSKEKLIENFGTFGLYLSLSSFGEGSDFVSSMGERSSISKEHTFMEDSDDFVKVDKIIDDIAFEIFSTSCQEKCTFKTVSIKIRLHDFKTYTRSKTFSVYQSEKSLIADTAKLLAKEFLGKKIRLIGVKVSSLDFSKDQKVLKEYLC